MHMCTHTHTYIRTHTHATIHTATNIHWHTHAHTHRHTHHTDTHTDTQIQTYTHIHNTHTQDRHTCTCAHIHIVQKIDLENLWQMEHIQNVDKQRFDVGFIVREWLVGKTWMNCWPFIPFAKFFHHQKFELYDTTIHNYYNNYYVIVLHIWYCLVCSWIFIVFVVAFLCCIFMHPQYIRTNWYSAN